jgi:hypothetical protein
VADDIGQGGVVGRDRAEVREEDFMIVGPGWMWER